MPRHGPQAGPVRSLLLSSVVSSLPSSRYSLVYLQRMFIISALLFGFAFTATAELLVQYERGVVVTDGACSAAQVRLTLVNTHLLY